MYLKDLGDWRTLALIIAVNGLLLVLVFASVSLPLWLVLPVLVPLITLHASLQHEVIHGHPFRNQWLNDVLVAIPFGVFVPYLRFRDTHLDHHMNASLCDPYEDPESWYQASSVWKKRSRVARALFNFNNTLAGRMLLGPAIGMIGFIRWDIAAIRRGERAVAPKWALHIVSVTLLLSAIAYWSSVPLGVYLLAAYGGMALLMVRTYLEHQAHQRMRGRSVIIEDRGFFAFLFLNNNYHAVHHAYPALSWYRLPALFRQNRERFLRMNEGYRYPSYRTIFSHFMMQKEPVPYPDYESGH